PPGYVGPASAGMYYHLRTKGGSEGMHGNAFEPIHTPIWVWDREETRQILKKRDVAGLFALAVKYAGASQVRLSAATGLAQGRISQIMRGQQIGRAHV